MLYNRAALSSLLPAQVATTGIAPTLGSNVHPTFAFPLLQATPHGVGGAVRNPGKTPCSPGQVSALLFACYGSSSGPGKASPSLDIPLVKGFYTWSVMQAVGRLRSIRRDHMATVFRHVAEETLHAGSCVCPKPRRPMSLFDRVGVVMCDASSCSSLEIDHTAHTARSFTCQSFEVRGHTWSSPIDLASMPES